MAEYHKEKSQELLRAIAASFIGRLSNRTSLITVTRVSERLRGREAIIYITVLPESDEIAALEFAKRNLGELRTHIKKHAKLGVLPRLSIEIDDGEKQRERLDELLRSERSGEKA